MKTTIRSMAIAATLFLSYAAFAQTAPAGSTGQCKDGTYSTAASKQGACRGHQGVKAWFAAPAAPSAPSSATAVTPAPAAPVPTPAASVPSAPAPSASSGKMSPSQKAAAMPQKPGGGPGLVWVNTSSNVYHCYGTDFYGRTKAGAYMSETDAKAKGAHADHGHACSK